jgi:hypothetical protein
VYVVLTAVGLDAPALWPAVACRLAPPLLLVNPALRLQTGQARGPWLARTLRAMAICSLLVARLAVVA